MLIDLIALQILVGRQGPGHSCYGLNTWFPADDTNLEGLE